MGLRPDLAEDRVSGEKVRRNPRPVVSLKTGLAVCGLIGGFGVTLAGLTALRAGPDHPKPGPPAPVAVHAVPRNDPQPAALDREWTAYSDNSTCADWAGGDGVSAVRLNPSQLAWFFSDSYLGPAGPSVGFSHLSGFVHNLVVVQTTAGTQSKFVTLTGGGACAGPRQPGSAAAVVSGPGSPRERYWDADGLRDGQNVLKFYNRFLPGTPPFIPVGTVIARFPVGELAGAGNGPPYGQVGHPQLTEVPAYVPPDGGTPIVWGSALLRRGDTVYVYGWQSPNPAGDARQLYLARVAVSRLTDVAAWRFYAGGGTWAAGQENAQPIAEPGAGPGISTGFSVVPAGGRYWLIEQAVQVGSPDIDAFPAPQPWGPFDPAAGVLVYRSPDIGLDAPHEYRIMYEARAEPALSNSQKLVISYNVNSVAVTAGCVPLSAFTNTITQPRFIAVSRSVFGTAGGPQPGAAGAVAAGASPYPSIISKDPAQWFNSWAYPGGCPPVPAVAGVAARPDGTSAWLEWPRAGIGIGYQVYLQTAGSGGYALVRTVGAPGIRLTGLARGTSYQVMVVPVNIKRRAGPGATVDFTVP